MDQAVAELLADIERYQRLIEGISDETMRAQLRDLISEAEAKLATIRKATPP